MRATKQKPKKTQFDVQTELYSTATPVEGMDILNWLNGKAIKTTTPPTEADKAKYLKYISKMVTKAESPTQRNLRKKAEEVALGVKTLIDVLDSAKGILPAPYVKKAKLVLFGLLSGDTLYSDKNELLATSVVAGKETVLEDASFIDSEPDEPTDRVIKTYSSRDAFERAQKERKPQSVKQYSQVSTTLAEYP